MSLWDLHYGILITPSFYWDDTFRTNTYVKWGPELSEHYHSISENIKWVEMNKCTCTYQEYKKWYTLKYQKQMW